MNEVENTKKTKKIRRFPYVFKKYDISCLINSFAKSNSLFWCYIKQIMNVFIRAMVRIFSFGKRWNVLFNSAIASLNRTFRLSPHENILTIALINIHYLYTITQFNSVIERYYRVQLGNRTLLHCSTQ